MIILDRYSCDWVTMTTFDKGVATDWKMKLFTDEDRIQLMESGQVKRWNYTGINVPCDGGSIFWGEGVQGKSRRPHWMIQVTGALADSVLFGDLHHVLEHGLHLSKCTRLDLQITHRDVGFFKDKFRSIGFMKQIDAELVQGDSSTKREQDRDGIDALCTVTMNQRTSPAFFRIYAKKTIAGHCIRFEMEFKKLKAQAAMDMLRENTSRALIGRILKKYAAHVNSELFHEFFDSALPATGEGIKPITVEEGESNTVFWLMTVVLPAFLRVISTDGRGDMVARAFMDAIRQGLQIDEFE